MACTKLLLYRSIAFYVESTRSCFLKIWVTSSQWNGAKGWCHPGRRAMLSQIITSGWRPIKITQGWYLVYCKWIGYVESNNRSVSILQWCHNERHSSQITAVPIVYSTGCSGADQRKYQSSASFVFARGIHRWLMSSPHKGPVMRKMFPFDGNIMRWFLYQSRGHV